MSSVLFSRGPPPGLRGEPGTEVVAAELFQYHFILPDFIVFPRSLLTASS